MKHHGVKKDPHTYGQITFGKDSTATKCEKESIFNR